MKFIYLLDKMNCIDLLDRLITPTFYFGVWASTLVIIQVSISDTELGFKLFIQIIQVLIWGYLIYALSLVCLYFLPPKKWGSK